MNDDELRALIRDAIARHARESPGSAGFPRVSGLTGAVSRLESQPLTVRPEAFVAHPSHYQYLALVNVGEACVIEPDVTCNHCGYCRSHGH